MNGDILAHMENMKFQLFMGVEGKKGLVTTPIIGKVMLLVAALEMIYRDVFIREGVKY
jgi:hypothetical protein